MVVWCGANASLALYLILAMGKLTCMESRLKINIRQSSSDVANHWPSGLTTIFMIVV